MLSDWQNYICVASCHARHRYIASAAIETHFGAPIWGYCAKCCAGGRRGNQVIYMRLNPLAMINLLRLDSDKKTWKTDRSGEMPLECIL